MVRSKQNSSNQPFLKLRFHEIFSGSDSLPNGCDISLADVSTSESEVKRRSLILSSSSTSGASSGQAQVMNMLKKPLGAANFMTSKLKSASKNDIIEHSNHDSQSSNHNTLKSISSKNDELNENIPTIPNKNGQKTALEDESWFHGVLPRGEVVRLLVTDGDFLVRETVRNDEKQIVLSVMWTSPRHFIVQTSPEGLYRFEGPGFSSVQELIMHQYHSSLPVTSRSGAILKTPIAREDWELNNDDVQLVEKVS